MVYTLPFLVIKTRLPLFFMKGSWFNSRVFFTLTTSFPSEFTLSKFVLTCNFTSQRKTVITSFLLHRYFWCTVVFLVTAGVFVVGGVTTGLTVGAEGVGTLGVAAGIVGVGVGVGSLLSGGKYDFISSNVNIGWVWPSLVLYQ